MQDRRGKRMRTENEDKEEKNGKSYFARCPGAGIRAKGPLRTPCTLVPRVGGFGGKKSTARG